MMSKGLIAFLAMGSVAGLRVQMTPEVGAPVVNAVFMGDYGGRHQARLWLGSLRQVGKWQGTVMMVSDHPLCLANTLGEELLGGKMEHEDENVHIYPGTGAGGRVHIAHGSAKTGLKKGGSGAGTQNKGFKMQKQLVWSHIEGSKFSHPVSAVIYTDEDIVFGKDLGEAIAAIRETEKGDYALSLFDDQGNSARKHELHTGVVVSYPTEKSKDCLATWMVNLNNYEPCKPSKGGKPCKKMHYKLNEELDEADFEEKAKSFSKVNAGTDSDLESGMMGIDHRTLGRTKVCAKGGINKLEPKFLHMPTTESMNDGIGAEFVHVTNTYRAARITKESQEHYFYDVLGLDRAYDVFAEEKCPAE